MTGIDKTLMRLNAGNESLLIFVFQKVIEIESLYNGCMVIFCLLTYNWPSRLCLKNKVKEKRILGMNRVIHASRALGFLRANSHPGLARGLTPPPLLIPSLFPIIMKVLAHKACRGISY